LSNGKKKQTRIVFAGSINRKNVFNDHITGTTSVASQCNHKIFITPFGECTPVHYGALPQKVSADNLENHISAGQGDNHTWDYRTAVTKEENSMIYELRQYYIDAEKREEWIQLMDEKVIPFQKSMGMMVVGSFFFLDQADLSMSGSGVMKMKNINNFSMIKFMGATTGRIIFAPKSIQCCSANDPR
jgi:hypothetical protein